MNLYTSMAFLLAGGPFQAHSDAEVIAKARLFSTNVGLPMQSQVRVRTTGPIGYKGVEAGPLVVIINPTTLEVHSVGNSGSHRSRWQRQQFIPFKTTDGAWSSYAEDFIRRGWPHLTVRRGNIKYNRYKDMLDSTARTVVMNMLVTAPANSELVRLSICFDLDDGTFMGVLGEPRVKRSNRRTGGPTRGGG